MKNFVITKVVDNVLNFYSQPDIWVRNLQAARWFPSYEAADNCIEVIKNYEGTDISIHEIKVEQA